MTVRRTPWIVVALAASGCGVRAPTYGGALPSRVDAWIPDDASLVIAAGDTAPAEAAALDAVAGALRLPPPSRFVEPPPDVAEAWRRAGVAARGAAWMQLAPDDGPIARCAIVDDAARAAAALTAAGGTAATAGGAAIVTLGGAIVVARDRVACAVTGGAASSRERAALRLATLGDDERLIAVHPEAATALARVRGAAYVAWGPGTALGGGVSEAAGAALGDAPRAAGVAYDVATRTLTVTVDAPDGDVAPGAAAGPPPALVVPPPPRLAADDNPDVPFGAEYATARAAVEQRFADAAAIAAALADRDAAARAAWTAAFGTAKITAGTLRWTLPAPPDQLRARADAAHQAALAGEDADVARYQDALRAADADVAALIKLRARDVAAWDRAH